MVVYHILLSLDFLYSFALLGLFYGSIFIIYICNILSLMVDDRSSV